MNNSAESSGTTPQVPAGPGPAEPDKGNTVPPSPPFPAVVSRPHASETVERAAALERGRKRRQGEDSGSASARPSLWNTNPAFAALAENVRDYAIFLLDLDGVITFWGTGAHLIKWWTRDEAEGAHLRLLYPEGGAEDGTAEEHLRQSETEGEYSGEGNRVRRDGSTFRAGITLTALRDPDGDLFGFVKVARDLSARRAADSVVATAHAAHSARDAALEVSREASAAQERAEESADFAREQARGSQQYIAEVLEPELAVERARSASLEAERKARSAERNADGK